MKLNRLNFAKRADKWLNHGMRNSGNEQEDDFKDAFRLLREVIKNPIGNQDHVTWFQLGWLLWKYKGELSEAEKAFYRASRLSTPQNDLYHKLGIRHLAYMQYLQGRHEDAYTTIQKVIGTIESPDGRLSTRPATRPRPAARRRH